MKTLIAKWSNNSYSILSVSSRESAIELLESLGPASTVKIKLIDFDFVIDSEYGTFEHLWKNSKDFSLTSLD